MKAIILHVFSLIIAILIPSCAVDYTFKNGGKLRFETTQDSIEALRTLEQGHGYLK